MRLFLIAMFWNFLHYFFKHISTTYPKDINKYEREPTFLRKLNLIFRVKNGHFWQITANFKISHNNLLSAYSCVKCYQNCCVTKFNAVKQHIQRGAQNFNGNILFKGKALWPLFFETYVYTYTHTLLSLLQWWGGIAQSEERSLCKRQAPGSKPVTSITCLSSTNC